MAHETTVPVWQAPSLQQIVVAVFLATCFILAWLVTPHKTWFEHLGSPSYESVVPKNFGDWTVIVESNGGTIIDPQQRDAVVNVYSETVSRTYLHRPSGRRVMLSIAYGDKQTFSKQLHRPESCYSSQGFKIETLTPDKLQTAARTINTMRMTASLNQRLEQVTYFIRVGDRVISGPSSSLNYARLGMALKGYITDGLLFRVSEVTDDAKRSNLLQDQFINDLLSAISPYQESMFIDQLQD